MISEFVDGLLPNLTKQSTLTGYASRSRDGIKFVDVGKSLIRYRVAGQGSNVMVFATDPPVVVEHYDVLIDLLKTDFKVVVFEPPGFGFSIPSMTLDYRYSTMVSLIEDFLEKINVNSATLVAPCALGYMGIGLAGKRPDLVQNLILSQVPGWEEMLKWKVGRDPKGLLSVPVIGQLLLMALKRKRAPVWLEKALGDKALLHSFNSISQEAFAHGASFNLASAFQRFLRGDSPIPAVNHAKTLFIWGDKDSSHCDTCKSSSTIMLPHAASVHFPDAGHFPELEASHDVVEHIVDFISGS